MKNEIPLGKLVADKDAKRDAVHVAILPAEALLELLPGQTVGLVGGAAVPATGDVKAIGIVDPFLSGRVPMGAICYICLFPNTITGMTHHWEHPDVDDGYIDPQFRDIAESQQWLQKWCEERHIEYGWLIECAKKGWITFPFTSYDDWEADLRMHLSVVLGKHMGDCTFTCAC